MTPEQQAAIQAFIQPYAPWVFVAAVAFIAYRHRDKFTGMATRAMALWNSRQTSTVVVAPGIPGDAIQAYAVLKSRFKGNPDAIKAVKAIWPFLDDTEAS